MAARRPNIQAALIDLSFAGAAAILGTLGAPWLALAGLIAAHGSVWAITRRAALGSAAPARRALLAVISVGLIGAVDAALFFLGSLAHGTV